MTPPHDPRDGHEPAERIAVAAVAPSAAPAQLPSTAPAASAPDDLVESDLLVEDVSIDGMCGVY